MNKEFMPLLVILAIAILLMYFKIIISSQLFIILLIYILLSLSKTPREDLLRWINNNQQISTGILFSILFIDFVIL